MTTLAAVLVRQKSAPLETVEQAMLRQSLFGGDLATNLLELQSIEERSLLAALALALECPPLDPGPIGDIPSTLRDVIPVTTLSEHVCVPIAVEDQAVIIATASPLSPSVELELSRRFDKTVKITACLEIRIRQALSKHFGLSLDERSAKLLARLDGVPFVAQHQSAEETHGPISQVPTPRLSLPAKKTIRLSNAPSRRDSLRIGGGGAQGRRLGPMTAADAESELSLASSPGAIIDIWLDFASQYFDYTAVFAVQGDLAAGKQARGAGTTGEPFSHIGVPLDLPSVLERARRGTQWLLTALEPRGLDRTLARDLGRSPGPQVLILPISVRQRVVLLTYGDHGSDDVELDRVGDVLALRPLVERHLERLVVERKRTRTSLKPSLEPTPVKSAHEDLPPLVPTPAETTTVEPTAAPFDETRKIDSVMPTRPNITSDLPTMPTHLVPSPYGALHNHVTPPLHLPNIPEHAELEAVAADLRNQNTKSEKIGTSSFDLDESWELIQPVLAVSDAPLPRDMRAPTNPAGSTRPPSSPPGSVWPGHGARPQASPKLELVHESDESTESTENRPLEVPEVPSVYFDAQAAQVLRRPSQSQELPLTRSLNEFEQECVDLVAQLSNGDITAIDRLLEHGDAAIGVLVRELPGPVTSPSRAPRLDPLVKASEFGPVLRALVAFGPAARPYVIARTSDGDPKIRAWSVRILGELGGRQAAIAIVQRVILDRDAEVKRAAHQACQLLYRDSDSANAVRLALLETAFDKQAVITQRLAAMDALTDLRDVQAIPSLIELLADPNPGTAAGAGQALVVLARQDFGYDQKKWNAWWLENAQRERIEWVIDALDHRQPSIRQAASEELRLLSRLYVGDYDDDSGEARAKIQKKYRDWWATGGRVNSMPPKR